MTILSLGAYTEHLHAIRTLASTYHPEPGQEKWVVPHATHVRTQTASNQSQLASSIRMIGKGDGPVSTMEILTQISHDNVSGTGHSGLNLWFDGQTSHVVTMDVENLIEILNAVFNVIKKLPGLKDVQEENILLYVNDFSSTSPFTRADPRFTPSFGSQCMFICPNGRVVCVTFDRVAVTSTNYNKFIWRCLSIQEGHDLALMKVVPTGFDYEPADGYVSVRGLRMGFFIREFSEILLIQPVSNNYAWAKTADSTLSQISSSFITPTHATVERLTAE